MGQKVLIIGYGSIGKRHAKILSKLSVVSEIRLLTKQKNEKFKTIKNFDEVKKFNPDYIIISNETYLHIEILKKIERIFSNKKILIEKPLSHHVTKFVPKKNKVWIGYNMRFNPIIKHLKKILRNKKVYFVNAFCNSYLPNWRKNIKYQNIYSADSKKGGGVEFDLSHEIDYVRWIFGDLSKNFIFKSKVSKLKIKSNDLFIMSGKTKSKIQILINLNYFTLKPVRKIFVSAENASYQADFKKNYLKIFTDKKSKIYNFKNLDYDYTYREMHKEILNNTFKNLCSFKEGMRINKILDYK